MRRDDWFDKEIKLIERIEDLRRKRKRAIKSPVAAIAVRKIDKLKTTLSKHRRKFPQQEDDE